MSEFVGSTKNAATKGMMKGVVAGPYVLVTAVLRADAVSAALRGRIHCSQR